MVKKQEEMKERVSIEDMPLETIRDYRLYNEEAARLNKAFKAKHPKGDVPYPYKQCPVELHPTERIIFNRNDQPENPLPVFVSNQYIHFEKTLIPGQVYDLPKVIVHYLSEKGVPVYKRVEKDDGTVETVMTHKKPRFAIRTLYTDM